MQSFCFTPSPPGSRPWSHSYRHDCHPCKQYKHFPYALLGQVLATSRDHRSKAATLSIAITKLLYLPIKLPADYQKNTAGSSSILAVPTNIACH